MKTVWLAVSAICIVAAAGFVLRGEFNAAFVAAVIGLVSWFLNYRAQVSKSLAENERKQQEQNKDGEYLDEEEHLEN